MYGKSIRIASIVALSLAAVAPSLADEGHGGHLIDGLNSHHKKITTRSEDAQRLFDQGLTLAYGFNHEEAADSFRAATDADPDCAMCYWGIALVLGPNINAAMDPSVHPEVRAAIDRALELAPSVGEPEQAYIRALAERYGPEPLADRSPLDKAYADAMRRVALRYPDDLDAATLFAEALMDTIPWDYWTEDGEPRPQTTEFIAALEKVLKRQPDHLGANHYLIHAVEKVRPDLGEPAAERLDALPEDAPGHLIHMASHIYIRLGRYADAARVNEKAIAADEAYHAAHGAGDLYAGGYMPHNRHFLSAAAGFQGRSEVSLGQAQHIADGVDVPTMVAGADDGSLQHYYVQPWFTQVRFGRWNDILAQPRPSVDLPYPVGAWRYARGIAYVRTGEVDRARVELRELRALARDSSLDGVLIWGLNAPTTILTIASEILAGEIASARGDHDTAIAHLQKAVELETSALTYDEPPTWNVPVRQILGAIYLAAGRPADAERAYREDLDKYPRNGWALTGLAQSLEAQGRDGEAREVRAEMAQAWADADVEIVASRFGGTTVGESVSRRVGSAGRPFASAPRWRRYGIRITSSMMPA